MAESLSHQFGQLLGDFLESAIKPLFSVFAKEHGLYLDSQGERPARARKKVSWEDHFGNKHDLDFVLERNGTPEKLGVPVAFIESAWRSYTKHSRAKAQEIQGAVLPLTETYANLAPFKGAVLAGAFTDGARTQLKSHGFSILYFPRDAFIDALRVVGFDAEFKESTPDMEMSKKVKAWGKLSTAQLKAAAEALLTRSPGEVEAFMDALKHSVERHVAQVIVIPLYGARREFASAQDAISLIAGYVDSNEEQEFIRFEIHVAYNNGDTITGAFEAADGAIAFLTAMT